MPTKVRERAAEAGTTAPKIVAKAAIAATEDMDVSMSKPQK